MFLTSRSIYFTFVPKSGSLQQKSLFQAHLDTVATSRTARVSKRHALPFAGVQGRLLTRAVLMVQAPSG